MSPRRIEIAGDAGWAGLGCAVPLFLLGAAVLVFPPAGVWGTGFLGLIFVAFGTWGALWRQRLILDADAGTVTSWQGFLRPMSVRSWPVSAFERVAIHCWRKGRPTTIDQVSSLVPYNFPIQLEGPNDTLRLEFEHDYSRGRVRAEEIARLLGLPLLDDCSQAVAVVEQPAETSEQAQPGSERDHEEVRDTEDRPAPPEPRKPWRPVMPPWRK